MTAESSTSKKRKGIHYRLYEWVLRWSGHRHAPTALFLIALAESSVFPIPPDVLLIAMGLSRVNRVLGYALIASVGSVLGGMLGYAIGWGMWEAVREPFYAWVPGFTPEVYDRVSSLYERWNFRIVFTAGFTPIPYKVFTIAAGVARINFPVFVLASAVSRTARFFLVAVLIRMFGPKILPFIERHLGWLSLIFVALLIIGFWILRLL